MPNVGPATRPGDAFHGLDPTVFSIVVAFIAITAATMFWLLRRHVTAKFDSHPHSEATDVALQEGTRDHGGTNADRARREGPNRGGAATAQPQRGNTNNDTTRNRLAGRLAARRQAEAEARAEEESSGDDNDRNDNGRANGAVPDGADRKKVDRAAREAERERLEQEREAAEAAALNALREDKKRKDTEEYNQWNGMFAVEERGEIEAGEEARKIAARREKVRDAVIKAKVAVLEDVAKACDESTIEALVKDIEALVEQGQLSGVFDERGKFVVISPAEFDAIARFIRQRGRVSMPELTVECNRVIASSSECTVSQ